MPEPNKKYRSFGGCLKMPNAPYLNRSLQAKKTLVKKLKYSKKI